MFAASLGQRRRRRRRKKKKRVRRRSQSPIRNARLMGYATSFFHTTDTKREIDDAPSASPRPSRTYHPMRMFRPGMGC
ncbi:hypothetical protein L249_0445 [Ophiocordyceps polyrhachis-furcata BCC 54312]|uniref:Uncharacterized protein n=1 Tax=Ophiocordyceps polyrhachis-furcata BCC 54312 TaxID=1330021 RepID=A0A367LF86_9HYPO|nr:hypothetical protein L249_0446 [Ophiocordyceps polyrhachis-furcata BCC 54312]RCI13081.1 hypothetical protein L249_0445 [Ophiocordyceps polyrhachis-furcata BCC 54312]